MEALDAIFGSRDFTRTVGAPAACTVRVGPGGDGHHRFSAAAIQFVLPATYPVAVGPIMALVPGSLRPDAVAAALLRHLTTHVPALLGEAMVFTLCEAAREWLAGPEAVTAAAAATAPVVVVRTRPVGLDEGSPAGALAPRRTCDKDDDDQASDSAGEEDGEAYAHALLNTTAGADFAFEPADDVLVVEATAEAAAADVRFRAPEARVVVDDARRGLWSFTVGLVGKPSAGKSTFFNAITDPEHDEDGARMAAFPFTTIEPNVGTAFFAHAPPPVPPTAPAAPGYVWGSDVFGRQKIPIRIKDVMLL